MFLKVINISDYFKENNIELTFVTGNEYRAKCPLHDCGGDFIVNVVSSNFICSKCTLQGDIIDFIAELGDDFGRELNIYYLACELEIPPQIVLGIYKNTAGEQFELINSALDDGGNPDDKEWRVFYREVDGGLNRCQPILEFFSTGDDGQPKFTFLRVNDSKTY